MKKIPILLMTLTLFFLSQSIVSAAELVKVCTVDLQRCMEESNEGKRIAESLKEELVEMQQRYADAQKELAELKKEIEKQSLMLSMDAKEDKQDEYDKKSRELTYLYEDLTEEAQVAQQNANQKILKEIYAIIQTVSKEQGFDLILAKSTSGVLFASDSLDITDLIIKELNKAKP